MLIFDLILLGLSSIYAWGSFLWHEWFHIKSQGFDAVGTINVHEAGMSATIEELKTSRFLFRLAGGLCSGILHLLFGLTLVPFKVWPAYAPILTAAVLQIAYGIYEAKVGHKGRYKVYAVSLIVMLIFWGIIYALYTG